MSPFGRIAIRGCSYLRLPNSGGWRFGWLNYYFEKADTAALGAKLLQLMRGQEAVQTLRNGSRFGVRLMLVAVPQSATGDRKVFVQRRYMHKTAVRQAGFRSMDE